METPVGRVVAFRCSPRPPAFSSQLDNSDCGSKMMPSEARPRVLVVDDDKRLTDALSVVLRQHGFDTITAYSGSEAIQIALKSPPDFILMDVMENGINGVDAAIAICEVLPSCRILLMSGVSNAVNRLDKSSKRGHRFDLMTKPVLAASLLDMFGR